MQSITQIAGRIEEVGFQQAKAEHVEESNRAMSDDLLLAQYEKWNGLALRSGMSVARDIARDLAAEIERRTV